MQPVFTKAKWIGFDEGWYPTRVESPAMQLRRDFEYMGEGDATCLICGLGAFVLYINGKRVGKDVLAPAFTAYDLRTLYLRYDVTSYLKKGKNVIAVKLGNGFYNQTTEDNWHYYHASWRNTPRLRLEIFNKETSVLASDLSWKVTYDGATVHNAIREGEYYDARKEDGWKEEGYDDSAWENVRLVRAPGGELCEQTMPSIRECETFDPIAIWKSKNGWTCDFGQNIAGYVGLKMRGKAGETVVFRYAEKLNGEEIDQSNINVNVRTDAYQEDRYTFKGEGIESWKPEFVYHGFRYVEISGVDKAPTTEEVTAYFAHTDLRKKGRFDCSDVLLKWIYRSGIYSFLGNYHGIPTDCPHREKNGWTADAMLSSEYAVLYFDMFEAYKKWLTDICDSQRKNGQICSIVPTAGKEYNWGTGPAWDCALFVIPYVLYRETGDTECIRLVYPYAKKYLQYIEDFEEENTVCFGLSDWCPPENVEDLKLMSNRFSDTCYYYAMLMIASEMAKLQGEELWTTAYFEKASAIKNALHKKFIKDDVVDTDGQGALATVLYFKIVEGEQAKRIARKLVRTLEEDSYKYKVGILGIKSLLNALSEYGYTDVAYKTVARYDYPSYGYWKNLGATTLWEHWDGRNSQNHHMYGDVLHWMGRNIAGLQNKDVSYKKCHLKPYFFEENCSAEISTETPYGEIAFSWKKNDNTFWTNITIPQGIKATLFVEGKEPIDLQTGSYEMTINLS